MKLGWTVQVIPVGEMHETTFPEDCKCKPDIDDLTGTIIHKALIKARGIDLEERE